MFKGVSRSRGSKGFSLVEVVMALGIMSFACATLMGLLGGGLITANKASGMTVQAEILQSVVNQSQVLPYSSSYSTNLCFNEQGTVVAQGSANQVYAAAVSVVPLQVGGASGYTLSSSNSGSMLKVAVTSRSAPSVTNAFSVVWCNSGN